MGSEMCIRDRPFGGRARLGGPLVHPSPSAAHSAPLAAYDGVREAVAAGFSGIKLSDPAGVGPALLKVVDAENPPLRVFFGTFQLPLIHQAYTERLKTWDDWAAVSAEAEGVQG